MPNNLPPFGLPPTVHQIFDAALKQHQALNLSDAEKLYRQILLRWPQHVGALHYLGLLAHQMGKSEAGLDLMRKSLAIKPDWADAHNNLANALQSLGLLDEAIAAYRKAVSLKPDHPRAHGNLGIALREVGQLEQAIAAFRRAITFEPNYLEAHSNLIFTLHFHPDCHAQSLAAELRAWNRQHADPLRSGIREHSNDRTADRRLRIGYVSPDFRQHVVGQNLMPLFRNHDRSEFEIICYSQVRRPDAMTDQFKQLTDRWHTIVGLPDQKVADQVREDRIDILVDLSLHMADNRLLVFARKPAPIQVTFAGYPGSTGISTVDYRISDPYLDPPDMNESVYCEKTVHLSNSFWCYDPLNDGDVPVGPLPAAQRGHVTFGCLNSFYKINDRVLGLWAQVLAKVEKSHILLLAPDGEHRKHAVDILRQGGVESARIEFASRAPRREYLKLYHRIDIGLDSFPYNGHTTSLDSLWMGVPVVTLKGHAAPARAGWCQLSNLGLQELAAESPDQFVQIAARLASDRSRLEKLRSTLRQRMEASPLMDAVGFARGIEMAYRRMWQDWCNNKV